MADLLEQLEREELRRVIVNLPPRHGKSQLCSQIFPAWYLGRHPDRQVMMTTHGSELSEKNGRAARDIVSDLDRWPFDSRLSAGSGAVHRWNLVEGGGMYSVGVDGPITGRGASLLILDDANHDASSELEQRKVFEWFSEKVVPRLDPPELILAIGTRFGPGDIFGKLLESSYGRDFKVLRLPAFAETNDPLGREVNAPLWPSQRTATFLQGQREMMGSRHFEAQYQQNPLPEAGDLFRAEWLTHRYDRVPEDLKVIMALDAASKTGISNDYSALAVLGSSKTHHYVMDMIRRKVDYPALRRMVLEAFAQYKPSTIYVEDAANAVGLVQDLKRETNLPIIAETPKGSKISRFEAQTGLFEAGKVLLPNERLVHAPWLLEFEREILSVPHGKHDDQADALCLALSHARDQKPNWFMYGNVMFDLTTGAVIPDPNPY